MINYSQYLLYLLAIFLVVRHIFILYNYFCLLHYRLLNMPNPNKISQLELFENAKGGWWGWRYSNDRWINCITDNDYSTWNICTLHKWSINWSQSKVHLVAAYLNSKTCPSLTCQPCDEIPNTLEYNVAKSEEKFSSTNMIEKPRSRGRGWAWSLDLLTIPAIGNALRNKKGINLSGKIFNCSSLLCYGCLKTLFSWVLIFLQ